MLPCFCLFASNFVKRTEDQHRPHTLFFSPDKLKKKKMEPDEEKKKGEYP